MKNDLLQSMKWKKLIRNKYVVASLAFLLWITFINDIDLPFILQSRSELNELKSQLSYYEEENQKTAEDLEEITTNKNTLEKFARENYFMKRSNEDVFVIREKEPTQ